MGSWEKGTKEVGTGSVLKTRGRVASEDRKLSSPSSPNPLDSFIPVPASLASGSTLIETPSVVPDASASLEASSSSSSSSSAILSLL